MVMIFVDHLIVNNLHKNLFNLSRHRRIKLFLHTKLLKQRIVAIFYLNFYLIAVDFFYHLLLI